MIGRKLAASAAAAILAGLMLFQILLALGYPLGKAAWGGYYTELPAGLRIASILSAALYAAFISITLASARLVRAPFGPRFMRLSLWSLTALFFLGTLMNLASQSLLERAIMTPLAFVLTICCYSLARHPQRS
ncbi:MAG: hypothetical protein ACLPX9_21990 [Rhodomicrobium sp.]